MTDIQAWLDQGRTLTELISSGPWELREIERYGRTVNEIHVSFDYGDLEIQGPRTVICDDAIEENNARFIADARTRLPQALNALQAVLDRHKPVTMIGNADFSIPLNDYDPDEYDVEMSTFEVCAECWAVENEVCQANEYIVGAGLRSAWPCPTFEMVQDALGDPQ